MSKLPAFLFIIGTIIGLTGFTGNLSARAVFLAFQSGTLHSLLSTNVGVLWQPEQDGKFEIRTFAITSISGGIELLSLPAVSDITITSTT